MTPDLEDRLRASLKAASEAFPPPPDLRARVEPRSTRGGRRRPLLAAAAVVLVATAAAGVLARSTKDDQRVVTSPASTSVPPADGWTVVTDPVIGWTFERPPSWTAQSFTKQCRISASGSVVTNLASPLSFVAIPAGCTTTLDLTDVPATFAGVEISAHSGGPLAPDLPDDTPFPLALQQALPLQPPPGDAPFLRPAGLINVAFGGRAYAVTVWIGPDTSAEDRAAMERIVASIRPPTAGVEVPPPLPAPCPAGLTEPVVESGRICAPEAPAGNGLGPDGQCTGQETEPPCGAGVEADRYYPFTLPLRCDGLVLFDGRRWISMLPPRSRVCQP